MAGAGYPPPPWRLTGDMYASLWRLPLPALPAWRLPARTRPLVLNGRATLVTFWVDYRPDGDLDYRELLVALAVTHRRRVAATAVAAWVDDTRSLQGGHALLGIPKRYAAFDVDASAGPHFTMTTEDGRTTSCFHRRRPLLPLRLPARAHLVQSLGSVTVRVPLRLSGTVSLARGRLTAGEGSPLAFLRGHTPVASCAVENFRFTVHPAR